MGAGQSTQRGGRSDAADQGRADETIKSKISVITSKEGGFGEDNEVTAEAVNSPDQDVSEPEKALQEGKRPSENVQTMGKRTADEDEPLDVDAKQSEMSKGFRSLFSNIDVKWTVKKGSSEITPDDQPKREDVEETAKETRSGSAEQNTEENAAQEAYDNDSTTCPTMTDVTSEGVLGNPEEKAGEDSHQDATSDEEPHSTPTSSSHEEEIGSPMKRLLMGGAFAGLWKRQKPGDDEKSEKELIDMGEKEVIETAGQHQDEEICPAVVEAKHENELKDEISSAHLTDECRSSSRSLSSILSESECPLKWLLQKKKQSSRPSCVSPAASPENLKHPAEKHPTETIAEEEGAWVSFKTRMTPKKSIKRPSLCNEETQIPALAEEPELSESEQISLTENVKKRKDSSISWDAVLCVPGRRRSRMSDSEDEMPEIDSNDHKQDAAATSPVESSKHDQSLASKQAGSPSEVDGGSTWKSLKRLFTPKWKIKDEDASKNKVTQVSYCDADQDAASGDEDSETPAVVPLSEFDTVETQVHTQTQEDIESHAPEKSNNESTTMTKAVLPLDRLQTEANKVQDNDAALEKSATPATNEEPDDVSKYQQLSDITEEGVITETMATAAEEAARDETVAEITSEAVTAPEPAADMTLADETEMISAVSQLTLESSKTSGNTTPVPAEYDVLKTETILHQVVETMSMSPKEVPVCSDELMSERIVGSASHQMLEKFGKREPTILEMHRRLDATNINTGLTVEGLDAIKELAATSVTESISEVKDIVSTEVVSEVSTGEFGTAESAVDEMQEVNVTNTEMFVQVEPNILEMHKRLDATAINTGLTVAELDAINELEATSLTESISEVNNIVSTELLVEVASDEFDAAETAVDQIQEGNATNTEGSVKDIDRIVETQHLVQCLPKTDTILHQVAETMSMSPKEAPVCSDELMPERIIGSASHQILENFVKEEPTILEMHRRSDANTIYTGLTVEELDAVNKLAAASLTESTPEVKDIVSVEVLSEVSAGELGTAESAVDEIQQVNVTNTEGSVKDIDRIVETRQLVECLPKTDTIRHQVVETMSMSPKEVLVCPDELISERIVGLAPCQILQTFVKEEPTILELHRRFDANVITTGLVVEELDTINELAATSVTESLSEVTGVVTTEVVSEVSAGELGTTEGAVDEIQEVNVINTDGSIKSSERIVETQHLVECLPEISPAASTDGTAEGAKIVADVGSLFEAHQFETEHPNVDSQDIVSAVATIAYETKDGLIEQEVQSVTAKEGPITHNITDQIQAEDKDQPPGEILELAEQAATLDSEGCVQLHEKHIISEPVVETAAHEHKGETMPMTEANVEAEKEDALVTDATKTEHDQVSEAEEAVQATTLESGESSVQPPEEAVNPEDVPQAETVTDEPKQTTGHLTNVIVELENIELPVTAATTEHVPELDALESDSAQTVAKDSEEDSIQSCESEEIIKYLPKVQTNAEEPKGEILIPTEVNIVPVVDSDPEQVKKSEVLEGVQAPASESEDVPEAETITDEPTEETVLPTEVNLEAMVVSEAGHVQESDVLEAAQEPTLAIEEDSEKTPEIDAISEEVPKANTITYEPKKETDLPTEVSLEPLGDFLPEHLQEPEETEVVQAAILESKKDSVNLCEKEVISEEVPEAEAITNEPKKETVLLTEEVVDSEAGHIKESEVLRASPAPTLDLEEGSESPEKEVISEEVPEVEAIAYEPKKERVLPSEVSLEPRGDFLPEHLQDPEVTEAVQAAILESKKDSVNSCEKESENIPEAETITDEPKEETVPPTEVVDPETGHIKESDMLEPVQEPTLDLVESSIELPEKELVSEKHPEDKTLTDEPKKDTIIPTEVSLEPLGDFLPEHLQEPEVKEAGQAAILESKKDSVNSCEKESENIPEAETITDEPKEETVLLTEEVVDSEAGHIKESEVLRAVPAPTLDLEEGNESPEKEVISEEVLGAEAITNEPKEEILCPAEVNLKPVLDSEPKHVQKSEVLEDSSQSLEIVSEDVPEAETTTDDPKEETVLLTEVNIEAVVVSEAGHVPEPDVLEADQEPTLDVVEGSELPEKEVISEEVPEVEAIIYEPKKETVLPTEVSLEPLDDFLPEHLQEPEVTEAGQAAILESKKASVNSCEKESENIPEAETITDEPKEETVLPTEVDIEVVVVSEAGHVSEPDVLETAQEPTLDVVEGSELPEIEVISEEVPESKRNTNEPKEETVLLTEEVVDSEAGHIKESEVLRASPAPTLDVVEGSESPEKEVISEEIPEVEANTYEPKKERVLPTEVSLEPLGDFQPEHLQEPEVTEAGQAAILESKKDSVNSCEKESENIPEAKTITDEPKEETVPPTEVVDSETGHIKESDMLEPAQEPTLDLVESSIELPEKEVVSEKHPEDKTLTDEPKKDTIIPTEVSLDSVDASKHILVPEVLQAVQTVSLVSVEGSVHTPAKHVISEDIQEAEPSANEPKEEILFPAEVNLKPVLDSEPEHVQKSKVLEGSSQSLEIVSEDVPEAETTTDDPKEETVLLTEVDIEAVVVSEAGHVPESDMLAAAQEPTLDVVEGCELPEKEVISEEVPKTEAIIDEPKEETVLPTEVVDSEAGHIKESEVLRASPAPTLDLEEGSESPEKEVISEEVLRAEAITNEPKKERVLPTEVSLEPLGDFLPEHLQEPEVTEAGQAAILESKKDSVNSCEKESENIPEAETITHEPKEETVPPTEVVDSETGHSKESHMLEPAQEPTLDLVESSIELHEKEVVSEKHPEDKTLTDEPKKDTIIPTEVSLDSVDVSKHILVPEVLQAVQTVSLVSVEGSVHTPAKHVLSEDIQEAEPSANEPKEEILFPAEVNLKPVLDSEPEHVQKSEVLEGSSQSHEIVSEDVPEAETTTDDPKEETVLPTEVVDSETGHSKESHMLEPAQEPTLDLVESNIELPEKEVVPEKHPEDKTLTDEPKKDTIIPTEVSLEPLGDFRPEHLQEPEVTEAGQAAILESKKDSVNSCEKESENIPEAETITHEPKEETVILTEEVVDSEAGHLKESEVLRAVPAPTLDLEEGSESPEKEVRSEEVLGAEAITNEPKEEILFPAEVNLKPVLDSEPEHVQKSDVLEASSQSLEIVSEDVPEAETTTDDPKEETVLLTEVNIEAVVVSEAGHVPEPDVLEAGQEPTLDVVEGSESPEKEVISEEVPEVEAIIYEPKKETVLPTEVSLEPLGDFLPEHLQEPEVTEAGQAAILESKKDSVNSCEKESENIPEAETITDEPKEETVILTEEVMDSETGHIKESHMLEPAQEPTLDIVESSIELPEKEVVSEKHSEDKTLTDEPKKDTIIPTEVSLDSVDASKHILVPEVLQAVQTVSLVSVEGSVHTPAKHVLSEDIQEAEPSANEPKEEILCPAEVNLKPVVDSEPEHVQKSEVLEGSSQSLEIVSEDVHEAETTTDEHKEETVLLNEEVVGSEAGHVPEPDVLEAAQEPKLDVVEGSELPEIEVISEEVPEGKRNTDELKEETVLPTEVSLEPLDASLPEHLQKPDVTAVQAAILESKKDSVWSLEKEVTAKDVPKDTNTDEHKEETVLPAEVNRELVVDYEPGHAQGSLRLDVLEAPTLELEEGSAESHKNEVLSQESPKIGTTTYEFKEETVLPTEVSLEPVVDSEAEHIQEPEVLEDVQAAALESEEVKVEEFEEESILDDIPKVVLTEEPKLEVQLSAVQVNVEQEKECEHSGTEIRTAAVEPVVACNPKDVSVTVPHVLIEETPPITEPLIDTVAMVEVCAEDVEVAQPLVKDDVDEPVEDGCEVVMMQAPFVTSEDKHRIEVQVADGKPGVTFVDKVLELGETEVKSICHEMVEKVDNLTAIPETEEELINVENKATSQEVSQHVKEKLPETVPEPAAANLELEAVEEPADLTRVESEINEGEDIKTMEDGSKTFRDGQDTTSVVSQDSATQQQVLVDLVQTPGSLDVSTQDQKEDLEETKALPITGRIVLMEQTDPSEAEVQAAEAEESTKTINSTQKSESQNQTKVPQVTVQVPENTEPAADPDSTERPAVQTHGRTTVRLEVDIQATEPVEPVEELLWTVSVICSVQGTDTIQPVRPTEEREAFQSRPVLSEAEEGKKDQEVWVEAEEAEVSFHEAEEHLEPQTASEEEVKEGLGHKVEMSPDAKTEEDKGEQVMHKAGEATDMKSEDEDEEVEVAFKDLEITTASVTTERD